MVVFDKPKREQGAYEMKFNTLLSDNATTSARSRPSPTFQSDSIRGQVRLAEAEA